MERSSNDLTLQGLLRFALEYTKSEDAPDPSVFKEMDPERREFLEKAIKSMTIDVIQEFEKAISILEDDTKTDSERLNALTTVREFIDNIDFANNFVKVGGAKYILSYLKSDNIQLKVNSIYILAEMCQQNPFCQQHFLEADVIPLLTSYFTETEEVANAALHANSAMVRNFGPGLIEFLKIGGIKATLDCLTTPHSRVFVKACFLIASLSIEQEQVRDEFVLKGAPQKLFSQLDVVSQFDIKIETILFALSALSGSKEWKNLKIDQSNLDILKQLVETNKNLPECEEMVEYAQTVLKNTENDSN